MTRCTTWPSMLALATAALLGTATGPAGAAPPLSELAEGAGVEAGLCVAVGVTDADALAALAADGRVLVQALVTDEAALREMRAAIQPDRYGLVSARLLPAGERLPYNTRMVDLLLVDADALGDRAPSEAQIKRVTAPLGAYAIKRGGEWAVTRVPFPEGMSEWTHWAQGPDGNAVAEDKFFRFPPDEPQWLTGPVLESSRRPGPAGTAMLRVAEGRFAYLGDHQQWPLGATSRGRSQQLPPEVEMRNAWNGLPLWRGSAESLDIDEASILDGDDLFFADGFKNGVHIARYDAVTGQKELVYDQGLYYPHQGSRHAKRIKPGEYPYRFHPKAIIQQQLIGDALVQMSSHHLVVLDRETGEKRWEQSLEPDDKAFIFCVTDDAGERVFVARSWYEGTKDQGRGMFKGRPVGRIHAYDLKSGKLLWTNQSIQDEEKARFGAMLYADGLVFLVWQSFEVPGVGRTNFKGMAIDAETGELLWKHTDYVNVGPPLMSKSFPVYMNDTLYGAERWSFSMDPRTGKVIDVDGTAGIIGFFGCSWGRGVVTDDATYLHSGVCLTQVKDGEILGDDRYQPMAYRTGCEISAFRRLGKECISRWGPHPYNTMSMLGAWFGPTEADREALPIEQRFERGPAWPAEAETPSAAPGWLSHLADARRSSFTKESVGGSLKIAWTKQLGHPAPEGPIGGEWNTYEFTMGPLSAPSGVGQTVYVCRPEQHQLVAIDAATGQEKWTFTGDGRFQAPPTIHNGLLYLGGRDGYLYCLRAGDGQLVWRFLVAPNHRQLVAGGQLESAWPVAPSPVIHKGELVVNAGIHTGTGGGVRLYWLDPLTGEVNRQQTLDSRVARDYYPEYQSKTKDGRAGFRMGQQAMFRNQLLVSDGEDLHMAYWRIDPTGEKTFLKMPGEIIEPGAGNFIVPNHNGFFCRQEIARPFQVGIEQAGFPRFRDMIARRIAIAGDQVVRATAGDYDRGRLNGSILRLDTDAPPAPSKGGKGHGKKVKSEPDPRTVWAIAPDQADIPYAAAMAAAGDTIILAGDDATLRLYALADGKELAKLKLPAKPIRDGIAVFGGKIFLSLSNGQVVCVTTK